MIEQAEIDRVKGETDLVKLIESSGVKLKRKGKQLAGLCPFHDDHEPSLIVDPKKQLWNCLGACLEGGDVYKWVMKRDRLDFKAAHGRLSASALLAPGEAAKEDDELKTESVVNDLLWLERAVEHYHRRLLETPAAQDYLRSRGIAAPEDEIVTHLQECRVKRVALALDSDDAGEYAAQRFGERLKGISVASRAVILPAKDCSEWIVSGATAEDLRALLAQPDGPEESEAPKALEKEADGSLQCVIAGREYRARGLQATGLDRLKINLRLKVGGAFHLDTLDLYQARSRAQFAQTAAKLCRVDERKIDADLLALIEMLEAARLEMKKEAVKDEEHPMTAEERRAALEFLRSRNLCERIVEDFRRCGFEGERATVLTAYLAAISRKLPEPLCTLVIARSGAGKSALQDAVCGLTPPEDLVRVTRLTGQALFYKDPDSLKEKLLSIAEEEGAQAAVYSLRTLASDQRLAIAATRTDPQTGKPHTEHYEVRGPVSIIITTTSPEAFDEETRSRFVPLTLDESEAQTKAILERQRRRYSLEGTLERKEAEAVRRLHHNAQRLLCPLEVINPFFSDLSYPTEKLIHRREQKKYLALQAAIALTHQYQREAKQAVSEETGLEFEYVEVTLDDIELANELTTAALSRALDELAPPVRGMYEEFRRLCEARAKEERRPVDEVQLTRREIREATGWSDWQVRVYCQQLVELEYLATASGANGKRFVYELAFYRPEGDGPPRLCGLVDVEELRRKQFGRLKEKSERRATKLEAKN